MSGLDKNDLEILRYYQTNGNRERYWNYLAQRPGNDGYGLLALGVVRNDNMPGAVANIYARNYAEAKNHKTLSERGWEDFGIDLIRKDFALRKDYLDRQQPEHALNLPALLV